MSELILWSIAFIVGLAVLVKSSDYFTDSAEKIGLRFGIPAFIVGVTIVAIGTSLPELVSALVAVFLGAPEIGIGNVVGANIVNILLIIGLVSIVSKKIKIYYELKHVDLPFLMGSTFLLALVIFDGQVTIIESALLIVVLVIYLWYTIYSRTERKNPQIKKEFKKEKEILKEKHKLKKSTWAILVGGAVFIYLGANLTVTSAIELSEILGISKDIIAISIISLGTTLPELAVSVSAARKKQPEIAIGNVLGSNIFNSLAVVGIPGLIGGVLFGPLIFEISLVAIFVLIGATLLYHFMVEDREITMWEGGLLLVFYVFFLLYLFGFV
ncbi:MAG: calcium/sodium antiporter [Candidatus Diapherotrites archaeon]|jgi:cation:H+ antiporter|uniref:Calcium/sodium antiporter n=1 Tax=Candidatus Iainarchaeum sp. TaxID=3101447 RepID=A0A8T5GDJ7_9ARCH|nr:calcium/sodium antiporter [Candidatus Diapherotrites archaeon]MBT7241438.1 calcium/sodium antiporter [Candidatus Diapherotrites archaeon]